MKIRSGTRVNRAALAAAALLLASALAARADDIRPATPELVPAPAATTRAALVLQADTVLSAFPRNAAAIPARSDAKAMTLEGRVREVRTVDVPAAHGAEAGTEVHLILVGKSQADEAPAHITCHMDKASADDALKLKPDMVVRLTGAVGTVSAAADRIDLINCHDLANAGPLTLAQKIIGRWGGEVAATGGTTRGRGPAVSGAEITFAADNTFTEEAFDGGKSLRKVSGHWSVKGPDDGEQKIRFDPRNLTFSENPAHIDGGSLTFTLPGLADLHLTPEVTASKLTGSRHAYDGRAMKDQVLHWLSGNLTAPNLNVQPLLNTASNFIDQCQPNGEPSEWYCLDLGNALLNGRHATQVLVFGGKMFVLPYSEAQTQRSGIDPRLLRVAALHADAELMMPEVKIQSFALDNKFLSPNNPLTGKITFHTIGRAADAGYMLMMSSIHGSLVWRFSKTPGADDETFDFTFDLPRGGGALAGTDPLAVAFTLCRQDKAADAFGDQKLHAISEPMVQLMDVAKN